VRRQNYLLAVAATVLAISACSAEGSGGTAADEDYPSKTLDMTVAFGPGGGVDIMSRTVAKLLTENDLYPAEIVVNNREGGSGSRGYGYVFSREGSAYDMTATSGSFISTPLQADTPWSATEFTPIALLGTDEVVVWVGKDSPIHTIDELIEVGKQRTLLVGGAGATTIDYIAMKQFADQAGFNFNYVAHDSGPEAANSLLSGSIDIVSHSASSMFGLYQSGDLRPIVIGGQERLDQLPSTPTFEELGYKITVNQPRGLVMPPGVPDSVVAWWQDALSQMVELPEWREYLADNFISERVLFGDDFGAYLEETVEAYAQALGS